MENTSYDLDRLQTQYRRIETTRGLREEDITTYELALDNLSQLQLSTFVEMICERSLTAVENWSEPIRLLFVDGSHEYEDVIKDLKPWEPWVCQGSIICMHDTGHAEGVVRAAREHLIEGHRAHRLLATRNLTVFQKRGPGTAGTEG